MHPQHEHGIIPGGPPTGFAPLGDAELDVQPQVALGLGEGLNLHMDTALMAQTSRKDGERAVKIEGVGVITCAGSHNLCWGSREAST